MGFVKVVKNKAYFKRYFSALFIFFHLIMYIFEWSAFNFFTLFHSVLLCPGFKSSTNEGVKGKLTTLPVADSFAKTKTSTTLQNTGDLLRSPNGNGGLGGGGEGVER